MIEPGKHVTLEYTLKLDNGHTVDTNVGREPLQFVQGEGQILPALEAAVARMEPGEEQHVVLPPEKGYGRVDPEAFVTVSRDRIPEQAQARGRSLQVETPDGKALPCRVHEVQEQEVVLDFNHPLAGKTLHVDVRVVHVV